MLHVFNRMTLHYHVLLFSIAWCISIKENFRNLFFVNLLGAVLLLLWISEMY